MSQAAILLFVGGWFVLFLLLGQNVSTVLLGSGPVGIALWIGPRVFDGILGPDIFYTASIYSLSIIPLYLVMAQLLLRGGVIVDLFRVAHRLSGYKRFPLGVATVLPGGLLGAVCGSGSASAAALATLAGPELERVGYTRRYAIGLAAVSGSLSAIIPPSLIVIIYGSITMVPIGHLFIGLVGPGLLCMLVYIACIAFYSEVKHGVVDGEQPEAQEDPRLFRRSVSAFLFVLTLMFVVFGGIYGGVITVAEAGAIGAFAALVGMVAMRRVTAKDIAKSLADLVKVTAMLMMLVIGAPNPGAFPGVLARSARAGRVARADAGPTDAVGCPDDGPVLLRRDDPGVGRDHRAARAHPHARAGGGQDRFAVVRGGRFVHDRDRPAHATSRALGLCCVECGPASSRRSVQAGNDVCRLCRNPRHGCDDGLPPLL